MGDSFYRAGFHLIEGVAGNVLREDIEGVAAVYLFRHYLELALKEIVFRGRYLKTGDELADPEEVKKVANIHDLEVLWKWVLEDAKPKILDKHWDNYDIAFVEDCVREFDAVDKKGFAFRYARHGSERCYFDFGMMLLCMDHIRQVLDGIIAYLVETYHEIGEWLAYLESQYGGDLRW
jgi:hypothetical protein